jgi:hypothetical protein
MTKTLSFGKYKGHTITEVLISDPEYLRWLCSQDEFRSRHRIVDIIDCVEGLADARERSAMRARFQQADFCRRFLQASGHAAMLRHKLEVEHARALGEITDRLRSLKEATSKAKNYIDDPNHQAWAQANGIYLNRADREQQITGFEQMDAALRNLHERMSNQIPAPELKISCRFEQREFDIIMRASLRYTWKSELRKHYLGSDEGEIKSTIAVKMRWAAGNNYHATVQWIGQNRNIPRGGGRGSGPIADYFVLLVGRYTGKSAAKEQFVEETAAADIKVVFADELEDP